MCQGYCWYFGELWNEEAGSEAQMLQRLAEGGKRQRYRPLLTWLLKKRGIAEPEEDIQGEQRPQLGLHKGLHSGCTVCDMTRFDEDFTKCVTVAA
jgi:hypothetical protein